jgi:FADH2 O2-dependent halogenase
MKNMKTEECDVVIIGTGLGGTILGAILARHGVSVILVDSGTHPRFAVGESTIATTTQTLEVLALRYDVPELNHLTSISEISQHVMPSCGVKRNFGYVYHREGQQQNVAERNQALVVNEVHYFRQDVDAYMLHIAARYGCRVHQHTMIEDVRIDKDGVDVVAKSGLKIRAKYIADGAGFRSPLADKLGLREKPTRCKTHARGLFTHMIDVPPFDEVHPVPAEAKQPVPWHQGTLHHIFDGGWLWVIPFNNTPESKNQLISIGLMLDTRKFPKTDMDGDTEFAEFLKRFPSIAPQFTKARSVREWVSADRIQYSSSECVGDRFCLLSHAAGFIDPLFSRGLFNTMQTTNVLADLLIKAVKDGDFSKARFAPVEKMQQGLIDFNDMLVNCSYISWRHYPLWNAWFRLWLLTGNYGQLRIQQAMIKHRLNGDTRHFAALDESLPGSFTKQEEIHAIFTSAARLVEQFGAGTLSAEDAEKGIYALLEKNRQYLPPFFGFTTPSERMTMPSSPEKIASLVKGWVKDLPENVKREYFDYPIEALFEQAVVKDTIVAKPA